MRVLVTGGAGYIGGHVVRSLLARGDSAVVVDDLSTGDADRLGDVPLVHVDLTREHAVEGVGAAIRRFGAEAVIHLAAKKRADESVARPALYYRQNLAGLANVLEAAEAAGVRRVVFSSSAAVYASASAPVDEDARTAPANPYGATKLAGEWLTAAHASATGGRTVSLRYFNVAGTAEPRLADRGGDNLVPRIIDAIERGERPRIFGDDYPTPDGTCIRDYIHVDDLAAAHLAALDALDGLDEPHRVYNVGTGTGVSVRDMVERMLRIAGSDLDPLVEGRRAGDPAVVVAKVDRIRDELGWAARLGVDDLLGSAWRARHG